MPTRRLLLAGSAGLLATASRAAARNLEDVERAYGGRLGLAAIEAGTGRTLGHRAEERFLMCSTFKSVLVGCTLSRVDLGGDGLERRVPYGARDLLGHSPVTAAHVASGELAVGALCSAAIRFSDNAAANLLLARVGGPAALTTYVRALGDRVTCFDRTEPSLNHRSGPLDTTTPRAFAGTLRTLLVGHALAAGSRARLETWMVKCATGRRRLRAGFPPAWRVGDKTGGVDGICNDCAIVRPSGRPPLLIAAYHEAAGMDPGRQEAVLRAAGVVVARWADGGG